MTVSPTPDREIQGLIDIICNTTEAFTAALFLAPHADEPLTLHAWQSLSRNINKFVKIEPGDGLVGWVHKNGKAVNVNKFDRDTRNLLFYLIDESIKSFMAVPLPEINGVLVVDSKQRYVFTEKSQKILDQFGKALTEMYKRHRFLDGLSGVSEELEFKTELEETLVHRLGNEDIMDKVLGLIREFSGARAAFLTAVPPGDPERYFIIGSDSEVDIGLDRGRFNLDHGLAGWIMLKRQALRLDRSRAEGKRSFVFDTEENLRDFPAFAGYPLVWGNKIRGGLMLVGTKAFEGDPALIKGLDFAARRLAAAMEIEFLYERVAEMGNLDPQVGLPHRTFFAKRLARMFKLASVRRENISLLLLKLVNLDDVARESGQTTARDILKEGARHLLSVCSPEHELGHVEYGILAVGLIGLGDDKIEEMIEETASYLADRPLKNSEGRVRIRMIHTVVRAPEDANSAETLIRIGLEQLAVEEKPAAEPEE